MDNRTRTGYCGKKLQSSRFSSGGFRQDGRLVERIITRLTEGEDPLNVDQLLVVTFTEAAAAEMKERIGAAIEKKLEEEPGKYSPAAAGNLDSSCQNYDDPQLLSLGRPRLLSYYRSGTRISDDGGGRTKAFDAGGDGRTSGGRV